MGTWIATSPSAPRNDGAGYARRLILTNPSAEQVRDARARVAQVDYTLVATAPR